MKSVAKWMGVLVGAAVIGSTMVGCSGGDPAPVVGDNEAAKQVVGDAANNPAIAERAKQKEGTIGQPAAPIQNNNSLRGQ